MQRNGWSAQRGLVFVLNNRAQWNGTWARTKWPGTHLVPAAWRGRDDAGVPNDKWTQGDGWVDLWAPPRGYAVYVPQ